MCWPQFTEPQKIGVTLDELNTEYSKFVPPSYPVPTLLPQNTAIF